MPTIQNHSVSVTSRPFLRVKGDTERSVPFDNRRQVVIPGLKAYCGTASYRYIHIAKTLDSHQRRSLRSLPPHSLTRHIRRVFLAAS